MIFPHGEVSDSSMRIFPQTLMALCCLYCIYTMIKKRNLIRQEFLFRPFYIFCILGLIYVFYPIRDVAFLYDNALHYMKSFIAIPFMFVLYLSMLEKPNETRRYIDIIYCLQVIYAFYTLWSDRVLFLTSNSEYEMFDSNAGFILICLLPMALTLSNKRLRLYLCASIVLACIYSGQRSAALAAVACFPFCLFYLKRCVKKIDIFIFVLAFVFIALPILNDAITNIQMRNQYDIDRDDFGSGRSIFWLYVWNGFWEGDISKWIFGYGSNSVPELLAVKYGMAIWSHNGWLDALYIYGFFGFVIYGCIVFRLYKFESKVARSLPEYKHLLLIVVILFIVKSSTSHGNWDITVMPLVMVIAILMATYRKRLSKL